MKTKKKTYNLKLELIEKLEARKRKTGLSLDKQVNTAVYDYFKYQNKSNIKRF